MTDRERFNKLSLLIAGVEQQLDELPLPSNGTCACNFGGHCGHHAAVQSYLLDAKADLERAQQQLRFPNGTGDKAAW